MVNFFESKEFLENFRRQVELDTWEKGRPMVYMKDGNIVEHWKDGTINILKTKNELYMSRHSLRKEIVGNELYLYNSNGDLIFKRWLDQNRSVVFDLMPYDKDTLVSITDDYLKEKGIDVEKTGWLNNIKYTKASKEPKSGSVNVHEFDVRWDYDGNGNVRVWVEKEDGTQSSVLIVSNK